jgi:hypothetical protein
MSSEPVSCAAVVTRNRYACLSRTHARLHSITFPGAQPYAGLALAGALSIALLVSPCVLAAEPAGHITIARDVPAHDAFHIGDAGEPTNVATANENIVIDNTSTIARIAQPLSDKALGNIAGQPTARVEAAQQIGNVAAAATMGIPASAFSQRTALSDMSAVQVTGSTIAAGTSSIAGSMAGLAGLK